MAGRWTLRLWSDYELAPAIALQSQMPLRILGLALISLLLGLAPLTRAMGQQRPVYWAALEAGCDVSNAACAQACEAAAPLGTEERQAPAPAGDPGTVLEPGSDRPRVAAQQGSFRTSLVGAGPPLYLRYHHLLL